MQLRSAKSSLKRAIEYEKDFTAFMENSEDAHLQSNRREEEFALLEKALADLDEEQRICVELFYLKNKSYAQISEITNYDLNKVKSYIQNGKRNLKMRLEQNNVGK
jgi:RNA polymerase sigma-70 factor (ECF subfamily)